MNVYIGVGFRVKSEREKKLRTLKVSRVGDEGDNDVINENWE